MASVYRRLLTCKQCNEWYTEPRRLHDNHAFCTTCIQRLPRDNDGQVRCPCCEQLQKLPDTGEEGLILETHLIEMLKDIKCQDCDVYNDGIKTCEFCKAIICPPCQDKHNSQEKCRVLGLIRQVHQLEPDKQQNDKIIEKAKQWKHVLTTITKVRKNLTETADALIEKIQEERKFKTDALDALEAKAKECVSNIENASVSKELVKSCRDSITAALQSLTEIKEYETKAEITKATLQKIEQELTEEEGTEVNEAEKLIDQFNRMKGRLANELEVNETQTEEHIQDESIQATEDITDAGTQTERHYTNIKAKRHVDVKACVPGLNKIYDISICPQTNQVYVTGRTETHTLVVVYNSDLQHIRHFTTGASTQTRISYITANTQGELMITNFSDGKYVTKEGSDNAIPPCTEDERTVLVMDEYGKEQNRWDTRAECRGIACDDDGNIYVGHANENKRYISKFNKARNFIRKIGEGELGEVFFLSVHKKKLYVSCYDNQTLFIFDLDGKLVAKIESEEEIYNPRNKLATGVCMDEDDQILWCDYLKHCVYVYASDHRYLTTVICAGELEYPTGIAKLPSGEIVVANQGQTKLTVF